MKITKQGILKKQVLLVGTCKSCGCEVEFSPGEPGVYRNASREDHRACDPTSYYVECPTAGCRSRIYSVAPPARKPSLLEYIF